jgi:hypothetical protein
MAPLPAGQELPVRTVAEPQPEQPSGGSQQAAAAAADEFIGHASAAVKEALPRRLTGLRAREPGQAAIFDAWCSGSDELAHGVAEAEGALAAARHLLERGNEILKVAIGTAGSLRQHSA